MSKDLDWDDLDKHAKVKGTIFKEDGKVYDFSETLYDYGLTGDDDE